jgi:hypothetical protein
MAMGEYLWGYLWVNFWLKCSSMLLIVLYRQFTTNAYTLTVPFLNPMTSSLPLCENFIQFIFDYSQ